jgi:hypothetical protein
VESLGYAVLNSKVRTHLKDRNLQLYSDLYVFPSSWIVGFVLTEVTTRYTVYGRKPKLPKTTPEAEAA